MAASSCASLSSSFAFASAASFRRTCCTYEQNKNEKKANVGTVPTDKCGLDTHGVTTHGVTHLSRPLDTVGSLFLRQNGIVHFVGVHLRRQLHAAHNVGDQGLHTQEPIMLVPSGGCVVRGWQGGRCLVGERQRCLGTPQDSTSPHRENPSSHARNKL